MVASIKLGGNPPPVVKIRIHPDKRKAFLENLCGGALFGFECLDFMIDDFSEEHDEFGKYWRMRLPAGEPCTGKYQFGTVTVHAWHPEDPDDEPPKQITAEAWQNLRLLLDGVVDDTETPESIRKSGAITSGSWIWENRILASGVTLLAGPPKGGKSTLLRGLLHAGNERNHLDRLATLPFLGEGVRPFKAIVISEETREAWRDAPDNARVQFIERPPIRKPSEWAKFIDDLGKIARARRIDLIALDTLGKVCGADENSAKQMARAFTPLRRLAEDYAVLVQTHTSKTGTGSTAVRGSSAIAGCADSLITIALAGDDESDPRRILSTVSRMSRPARVEYAMAADGTLDLFAPAKPGRRARRSLIGGE